MQTKKVSFELLAGLWIYAKASTIFANDEQCQEAWAKFEYQANYTKVAFGLSDEQLATDLKDAAAELYTGQLLREIFGYDRSGIEKQVA